MTVTIDLAPEEEQNLRRRAEMAGQDVGTYLVRSVGIGLAPSPPVSNEEWEKFLDEFGDTDAPLLSGL